MEQTTTFNTKDGCYAITVLSEFLKRCPDPTEHTTMTLLAKFKMNQFFHNSQGPAIIRFKDNRREFWLNGSKLGPEESARIEHSLEFNEKLLDIVND